LLLTIEKLIYGGDGLSHLPADASGRGKAVFVPFVLPGEKVEASVTEQKPGFARARVENLGETSPHRIEPGCPYFKQCGGCHYQHIDYQQQLEIKKEILRETLRRTAKLEFPVEIQLHRSPPWNYRNRSRLQVETNPEFKIGYFKMRSHEVLPIELCPISSPLINRGIELVWQSGRAGKVPPGTREMEFFVNAEDSRMLIEIACSQDARRAAVRAWAEDLCGAMPEIAGCVAFRQNSAAPHTREKLVGVGSDHISYQTGRCAYRVSAGAFFQVNRYLTDELVEIVTAGQSGEWALDLYAGAGLFSAALARDIDHVVSVESSQTSSADLRHNLPSNAEAVQATTEQYLARAENKGRVGKGTVRPHNIPRPELAVVDPPRNGLGERVARMLATLGAPRVVYVSCDPATLARDLVVLLGGGYRIEQIHLVDLFPQTYHLESVVDLAR
jgi:23S rRNA (uracil1939-C5)-methyltransferase